MTSNRNETIDFASIVDEDQFKEVVEPHMPTMVRLARRELAYYVAQRQIHPRDFTPEEVAGEAWIHAWQHRARKPEQMSLRGWLLGITHRMLVGLVSNQQRYREDKSISLDEPLPVNVASQHTEEFFWDWHHPDAELTWEDVTPAAMPEDLELTLDDADDDQVFADEGDRHALMMHYEFAVPIPEVSYIMNRAAREVGELIASARVSLSERGLARGEIKEVDEPTPPRAADR